MIPFTAKARKNQMNRILALQSDGFASLKYEYNSKCYMLFTKDEDAQAKIERGGYRVVKTPYLLRIYA